MYYVVDDDFLYLNFKPLYQAFREQTRGRERDFDDIGENGLRRLIRESKVQDGYVVNPAAQKWIPKKGKRSGGAEQNSIVQNISEGKNIRTVQISLEKAREYGLDLSGFGLLETADYLAEDNIIAIAQVSKRRLGSRRRRQTC